MAEDNQLIINYITDCKNEADHAKRDRMEQNELNFDVYHLRHDFSHKNEGQSQEVLSKQPMAVEQSASFFQQALTDIGDWFDIKASNPKQKDLLKIRPSEVKKILARNLERDNFFSKVGNGVKLGMLGSLMIAKVTGERIPKPKFKSGTKKKGKKKEETIIKVNDSVWKLCIELIRQEDFYPDPSGDGLYEIETMWTDLYKLKKLAEGDKAIYDMKEIEKLERTMQEDIQDQHKKSRETGQNSTNSGHRHRVKLTEFWGTILDKQGNVVHENVVCTIANDKYMIRPPEPNPYWHQESPFVVAAPIEVPNSVWHKALMDAPTRHNIALNEIYNLILDGAMKAVQPVSQVRVDMLDDPSQVENGIESGVALKVTGALPFGAKVMEPLETANVPQDGLSVMNVVQQEFNSSALTSDLRQGVIPFRQVKATEVVEASNTITSVFNGMSKQIEQRWIQPILRKSWMLIAQRADDLNSEEMKVLLGEEAFSRISSLSPQKRFLETVDKVSFEVYGITKTLNRNADFRKYTTLLQTIAGSELLMEEAIKRYDIGLMLEEIIDTLGLEPDKIKLDEAIAATMGQAQDQVDARNDGQQSALQTALQQGAVQPGTEPNQQSQISGADTGSLQDLFTGGGVPQANFPPSRAT